MKKSKYIQNTKFYLKNVIQKGANQKLQVPKG